MAFGALLALAMAATPALSEEQAPQPVAGNDTLSDYQDYIEAVRAQRKAQREARRRAMQEEAENWRQMGEARRRALNDLSRRPAPPPPFDDDPQHQWPEPPVPPPFWDNNWYYRGY